MASIHEEYVKYLITSPLNQTQTYMGEHHHGLSHDQVNRYMRGAKLRPRHLWQAVQGDVVASAQGFLLFDDTVINKEHSEKIEMAQVQYSGNVHGLVMGISIVNCVYYNPETNQFWEIDYRIYNPASDGRDKLDHMADMLKHTIEWKKLPFYGVLMDTWYATNDLMKLINGLGKKFYCPIKENRKVHQGVHWTSAKHLAWDTDAQENGHPIRLKKLDKSVSVRLHRQATVTGTGGASYTYLVTNDIHVSSQTVIHRAGHRWKVEELHRETKQLTALERCQCRKARAQRNHIACANLAWVLLKRAAYALNITVYRLKEKLLSSYIIEKLNSPLDLLKFA
jgi:Transposase DDE domain